MELSHIGYLHSANQALGDPIECESIRVAFGGPQRTETLYLGSVKSNIGHTEGTSGVAALIKATLMIQQKTIPIQANFTSLNPKIRPLEIDRMAIPLSTQRWNSEFRAVCINNYGAAGSNAAMIVCQAPTSVPDTQILGHGPSLSTKYPVFISAKSTQSLQAYCASLRSYIARQSSPGAPQQDLLASLAFNLANKQNRSFSNVITSTAATLTELGDILAAGASASSNFQLQIPAKTKPVVLVFGGQVNTTIGLPEDVYRRSIRFRFHLDHCNTILCSSGLKGLFPSIFQSGPVEDIVSLHSMLFSLQYSCAKSWMDCGLAINAVLGHSFGQLTALCISGCLSLEDGLKLVTGRATLMEKYWGSERGSMVAIEADINTVSKIISLAGMRGTGHKVEIACYNGPTSHVLVGNESSIKTVEDIIADNTLGLGVTKCKKLVVTHGFHSEFTDPILPGLTGLAQQLVFREPDIPLETCSNGQSWTQIEPHMIAEHTRTPVYFSQAVERITSRLGACTWLEAGVGSSVTGMVRRSLSESSTSEHLFQSIQFCSSDPLGSLADSTINLWKAGYKVQFWPFHRSQTNEYASLNLPPYQFEKSRHWLTWVDTSHGPSPTVPVEAQKEHSLLSLVNQNKGVAEFSIDPQSEQYKLSVEGHAVLANPLCPAPLYVELVALAAMTVSADGNSSALVPRVEQLEIKSPLGIDLDRVISLILEKADQVPSTWTFNLTSQSHKNASGKGSASIQHATGMVSLHSPGNPDLLADFARFGRLIGHNRCDTLAADPEAESLQGAVIYKVFSKVVQYAHYYKGIRSISAKAREVTGQVVLPRHNLKALESTVCNPLALDNFIQVAGLHVNSLNDIGDDEVFVCTKVDSVQPSTQFRQADLDGQSWTVYSNLSEINENNVINDIFVFDSASKSLVMMVLGAHFTKVLMSSLTKVLSRANSAKPATTASAVMSTKISKTPVVTMEDKDLTPDSHKDDNNGVSLASHSESSDLQSAIQGLLSRVADIPIDTITLDSTLLDLGIDSLMVTEVLSEVRQAFGVDIPLGDFQDLQNIKSLCNYLCPKVSGFRGTSSISGTDSDGSDSLSNACNFTTLTSASSFIDVGSHDGLVSQLAKLVGQHLETSMEMNPTTSLSDAGLDSLLSIELLSDIEKMFGAKLELVAESTFGDLCDMVLGQQVPLPLAAVAQEKSGAFSSNAMSQDISIQIAKTPPSSTITPHSDVSSSTSLVHVQRSFEQIRYDYDRFAKETRFCNFWTQVYPAQARLVVAYVVEAFESLGCSLASLRPGNKLPTVQVLPKHNLLMAQLYEVLKDASLISLDKTGLVRTDNRVDTKSANELFHRIILEFPQHASEHKLLHITGSRLADCLSGAADPLQLLFRRQADRDLLEDVYTNGPMYMAVSRLLGSFFTQAFAMHDGKSPFHILELGGGTGGTTKYIVDHLIRQKIPFTYTFTDISPSLVAAAKKKFAGRDYMQFTVIDIEKNPLEGFTDRYHAIISTNCIHATRNLVLSAKNIRKMLRRDGFVSLVEFTRNMFWFDLVFGLLEGWWLFEDGRGHVLADEMFWGKCLKAGGFKHVAWTEGDSAEANTLRIIVGFQDEPEALAHKVQNIPMKPQQSMETVIFKQVGELSLLADIYYPSGSEVSECKRPVGIEILIPEKDFE